jgi:hypothetical protein
MYYNNSRQEFYVCTRFSIQHRALFYPKELGSILQNPLTSEELKS